MQKKRSTKSRAKKVPNQVYLVALTWLVTVGVSLGVGWPNWQKIMRSREQIERRRAELVRLVEKQSALTSLDEAELEEKVQRTIRVLPVQQDFAGYLASIRHLASTNNLIVRSYSLSPGLIEEGGSADEADRGKQVSQAAKVKSKAGGPRTFEIETLISGQAEDMARFFRQLESSAPVKSVPAANLLVDESAGGMLGVTAKLVFEAYYQPLPDSLPPISSRLPVLDDQDNRLLTELFEYEIAPRFAPSEAGMTKIGKINLFAE